MAKDPALLFYPDKWLLATAEMTAQCRGWYLNLILHQFDKGSLPSDLDSITLLAGVRPSEYILFEQVFEQVLSKKFKQNDSGRLENQFAREILQKREAFKDKRSESGKWSYLSKVARSENYEQWAIEMFKAEIDLKTLDTKDLDKIKQVFKQVFEQNSELYINVDVNENIVKDSLINNGVQKFDYSEPSKSQYDFDKDFWTPYSKNVPSELRQCQSVWMNLTEEQKQKVSEHAPKYAKSNGEAYRHNPFKYLSQGKYLDPVVKREAEPEQSGYKRIVKIKE